MSIIKKLAPKKYKLRTGDLVAVIAGDSKGQQGKITSIIRDENRAVVEGVNMVTKHQKPSAGNPNGGIIRKEAPIHISNLMLINVATGKPTRVGRKLNAEGKLVRFAKTTGEEIKNG